MRSAAGRVARKRAALFACSLPPRNANDSNDPARSCRAALASTNRRAGQNGGATCRLRLDEQLATYELQPFLHAGQAESQASIRRVHVEANSFITNGELDEVPGSAKMHAEMPDPAVSHRVVQGLLEDAEETERHVRRYTARNAL